MAIIVHSDLPFGNQHGNRKVYMNGSFTGTITYKWINASFSIAMFDYQRVPDKQSGPQTRPWHWPHGWGSCWWHGLVGVRTNLHQGSQDKGQGWHTATRMCYEMYETWMIIMQYDCHVSVDEYGLLLIDPVKMKAVPMVRLHGTQFIARYWL